MAEKHYLTAKELRKISRENMKTTAAYEKKKKQKVDPATYATVMKDPGNVLEIEDLHTFFFTDAGIVKSVNGVSFEVPQQDRGRGRGIRLRQKRDVAFHYAAGAGAAGADCGR